MELYQNIKGKKLQKMFEFFNGVSDCASVERYVLERIPEEEFEKVQIEYREHILEADSKRREEYNNDKNNIKRRLKKCLGICNEEEAKNYFDELLEQELEVLNSIENDGEELTVNSIEKDVILKKYTRVTKSVEGPIMQQYYIKIGDVLKNIEENMSSIFEFPYKVNGGEYENLTFYKDEKAIFSICSHEKFASVIIDNEQKKELEKIGIKLEEDELER